MLDNLHEMLNYIEEYCAQKRVEPSYIKKIILATEEAIVNVIKHGYFYEKNIIEIECKDCSGTRPGIQIIIKDYGIPFNPIEKMSKEKKSLVSLKREEGGYGIFLYLEIMDKVDYKREENANFLYLIKYT